MDVQLSEEQGLLQRSARDFLAAECGMAIVRECMDDPRPGPPAPHAARALWKQMAELGWTGLVIPEAHGGAGLDAVDLAVLLEEMGRVLLPGPYLSTLVGASAITLGGSEEQRARLLPRVARGDLRLSLAWLEEGGSWAPEACTTRARRDGDATILSGTKLFVPDADLVDQLVVLARSEAGPALFLVERDAPGVAVRRIDFVDPTRPVCEVVLDDVAVGVEAIPGGAGGAEPLLEDVLDFARVALSAEMCGGAQQVLDLSVAYAKTREQFGKPIGSFQAIAHKCTDMFVKVESARSAVYYAAWALAAKDPSAHLASCMAKSYCAEAYSKVAAEGIQIHGGLGFTWEQDPQLYFKRAKADELAFGDVAYTRELAAAELIG